MRQPAEIDCDNGSRYDNTWHDCHFSTKELTLSADSNSIPENW